MYQFVDSTPVSFVDPSGLTPNGSQGAQPSLDPKGSGTWGQGDQQVAFGWEIKPTAYGMTVTADVIKEPGCMCDDIQWIEYTIVTQNGGVFTPTNPDGTPGWPYDGIDQGGRNADDPYVLPIGGKGGQRDINAQHPTVDSYFNDPADSGKRAAWHQLSVVVAVCVKNGVDRTLGGFIYEYGTDRNGNYNYGGGRAIDDNGWNAFNGALHKGFPKYQLD
jgi:hypothetical protein